MNILIIEDDKPLVKNTALALRQEGYICELAHTVAEGIDKISAHEYDCILLDVSLPDGNGLKILSVLRADNKRIGVIIITATSAANDKVHGLNLGADDYLAKPFALPELKARVSALIRRKQHYDGHRKFFHEISIDLLGKVVFVHNKPLTLTPMEFGLLLLLMAYKNRLVTRNTIAIHFSGDETALPKNLDFIYSHIKNLKKKLAKAGSEDYIKTIYGRGYILSA